MLDTTISVRSPIFTVLFWMQMQSKSLYGITIRMLFSAYPVTTILFCELQSLEWKNNLPSPSDRWNYSRTKECLPKPVSDMSFTLCNVHMVVSFRLSKLLCGYDSTQWDCFNSFGCSEGFAATMNDCSGSICLHVKTDCFTSLIKQLKVSNFMFCN